MGWGGRRMLQDVGSLLIINPLEQAGFMQLHPLLLLKFAGNHLNCQLSCEDALWWEDLIHHT